MYSEKTLRRKASAIGIQLQKGYQRYLCGGTIVKYGDKPETGYNLIDTSTGVLICGSIDSIADHQYQLDDIEDYLRSVYENAEMKF